MMIKVDVRKFSLEKIQKNYKEMEENSDLLKSYKSVVKSLGALLIQNGLYASLIYIVSKTKEKSKNNYFYVLSDISDFMKNYFGSDYKNELENSSENIESLKKEVLIFIESDAFKKNYKEFQEQFLELIKWHRRFIEIYISDDVEEKN